ncbi:hypothetical protein EUGRSUZ_G02086 [Eucalyptus grandis]|uniref:Uncharacterized protein n=2 Tax=Eucalyptus grandis TaxID=71139 RepID=A0A059BE51_EUCGR|nr:hypothetical protein EUGRSUZ_G02086 [Eucalyptus grandis]
MIGLELRSVESGWISLTVRDAYTSQFAKDTVTFLHARRQEIASGGIMVLIMPGIANDIPHSCAPSGFMFDLLGFSLMDMAKEEKIGNTIGTISFLIKNSYMWIHSICLYTLAPSPDEMTALVESDGCFCIERMYLAAPRSKINDSVGGHACMLHLRAGMEGIINKFFGNEIIDDLFDCFLWKTKEFSDRLNFAFLQGTLLVVILKRK